VDMAACIIILTSTSSGMKNFKIFKLTTLRPYLFWKANYIIRRGTAQKNMKKLW